MARAMLTRVFHAVLSMVALVTIVFFLVRLTGDPTYSLVRSDSPPEVREQIRREFGLDQPVLTQYAVYMSKLLQGDLGQSFGRRAGDIGRIPVTDLIIQRIPATLTMAIPALLLVVTVGVPLGIYSAYWRGGRVDRIARIFAAFGQATPSFTIGLFLILIFAVNLGVLPAGGYGGIENVILPAILIAFGAIAGLIRLLRSSTIEVLSSDYVTFLRMKGVPERTILWKHALRNAGLTSLSYMGVVTAGILTGSVIAETMFVWPGVGRLMIEGVERRDFPIVQGVMLLFSFVYITMNLVVDLLYVYLNPRLR
jgi:peptide/nickel transport system permease protein